MESDPIAVPDSLSSFFPSHRHNLFVKLQDRYIFWRKGSPNSFYRLHCAWKSHEPRDFVRGRISISCSQNILVFYGPNILRKIADTLTAAAYFIVLFDITVAVTI